jgi:hypothetical protein
MVSTSIDELPLKKNATSLTAPTATFPASAANIDVFEGDGIGHFSPNVAETVSVERDCGRDGFGLLQFTAAGVTFELPLAPQCLRSVSLWPLLFTVARAQGCGFR